MPFNFKKVKDTEVIEAVKASASKRGPRNSGRTLEVMLREYMDNLASDSNTVAIADTDGSPLVVCRELSDDGTVFGWQYDSLPTEITDKVTERANNSDAKIRKSHEGWLGVRNTLRTVAKDYGLSIRFVSPQGETATSDPFKESDWEDTPTFGCLTFRPYKERAKRNSQNGNSAE